MNKLPLPKLTLTKLNTATLIGTTILAFTVLLAPSVQSQGEQATSADAFVDSLGINTHLNYTKTAYGKYQEIIKPRLQELGVRHIRDGGYTSPSFLAKLRELGSLGIKSNLTFFGDPIPQVLTTVKQLKGSIVAVEGANESDLPSFKFSYNGLPFPEGTRVYQQDLYNAIKSDPETQNLPVLMPSLGSGKNTKKLGAIAEGDIGNMHSYPNKGNPPTDGLDWWFIPNAKAVVGNQKPLWSTETGYHTLTSKSTGISGTAAGKYIPRLWLKQFSRGVKRVYLYELIDQKPDPRGTNQELHYGLLRYDGSPKPAYTTLKNMITLLAEPNAQFTPGKLDYSIDGDKSNLHHTLLQKSNGDFYLVVWQEAKSWDNKAKRDINVPQRTINLNLRTPINRVTLYNPALFTQPIWQNVGSGGQSLARVAIDVPDSPVIAVLSNR